MILCGSSTPRFIDASIGGAQSQARFLRSLALKLAFYGDGESVKLLRRRHRFNIGHLTEIYTAPLPKPSESTTFRVHRFRIQSSTGVLLAIPRCR